MAIFPAFTKKTTCAPHRAAGHEDSVIAACMSEMLDKIAELEAAGLTTRGYAIFAGAAGHQPDDAGSVALTVARFR